jgi:hypothetical protein
VKIIVANRTTGFESGTGDPLDIANRPEHGIRHEKSLLAGRVELRVFSTLVDLPIRVPEETSRSMKIERTFTRLYSDQ